MEGWVPQEGMRTEECKGRKTLSSAQACNDRGKEKGKLRSFKLCSEIEQATNLKKVMEERFLDSHVEFTV